LDVTDPSTLGTSSVLWEYTDANDADMGLTYSQPAIVRLHNGRWAAVFGNGYNSRSPDGTASTTGNAEPSVGDAQARPFPRELHTGVGTGQAPTGVPWDNGLSTPALVDLNNDRVVEYAYAGDLYGNMWKFDLSSPDRANWSVSYGSTPLYSARDASGNAQP